MMKTTIRSLIEALEQREERQPLMPAAPWRAGLETAIGALDWSGHDGQTVVIALMAGLHLRNDSLNASHSFAQQIEYDATGAYWHGIMHRMEGDFSNSKYWFYQAGRHPAMKLAAQRIAGALRNAPGLEHAPNGSIRQALLDYRDNNAWNPSAFTDIVQSQRGQKLPTELQHTLEHVQFIETAALFDYTLEACAPYIPADD